MARKRGWSRISLSVSRSGNPAARVLYDRLGYSDAGEPPVHVTGQVQLRTGVLDVDDVLIYLQKEL